jgi:hypothetical protein
MFRDDVLADFLDVLALFQQVQMRELFFAQFKHELPLCMLCVHRG